MALVWLLAAVVCGAVLHAAAAVPPPPPPPPRTTFLTPGRAGPRWELYTGEGDLPNCTLVAGYSTHYDRPVGSQTNLHYVGRASHAGGVTPILVTKYGRPVGYGTWNNGVGSAIDIFHFEVACVDKENVRWVPAAKGQVPDGALVTGVEDGKDVFSCRAFDDGPNPAIPTQIMMMMPGALRPATGVCTVHFFGIKTYPVYEVLVAAADLSVEPN